ncbi:MULTISPECIES: extracellular solute-binding protein [unclassified Sulfitobacter]|uniref:extracellular solute-binding protein n=1 Tax=unclassified Sulfitobacter TaxID=196795 RepID=UPI0023E127EE|nr:MULTISPECIES: extracellular solute-binding protein [unclassified Sulfitobacter]
MAEEEIIVTHGYNFYGNLSYPADYEHFNYVNPNAPKGGEMSVGVVGTFDSMNRYARKGNPDGLANIGYESLLADAPASNPFVSLPADVYGEYYGLLAERLEYPATKDWVIFYMRKDARFSDGTPVTAHDVEFSHNLFLDQGLKSYGEAVRRRIPKVEVIDDHTIKFYFTKGISRRSLIDQAGGVPVMSKKWFEKTGARLDESRLDISPGSGPYVLDHFDINRRVVYKRNPDYWGWHLPINKGRHNFDSIRLEYFTDPTASFEAFKAGVYTFRREGSSKIWSTGYDFPKAQSGAIVKEVLPDGDIPQSSGFVFNLGSAVMQQKDVRRALGLAYNFQWTNESLQYGLFKQRRSFVQGTDRMASGKPEGAELAFLKGLGDVIPSFIFDEDVPEPHVSKPERLADRRNMRKATKLLDGAGWAVGDDGIRRNADGDKLTVNFLISSAGSPTGRAIVENYISNLKTLGVDAVLEAVDSAQFSSRRQDRDYDMILGAYLDFREPDTNLEQMFGSEAASYSLFNPAGISDPAIDAIISASLAAESLEEEAASIMALDRALRHQVAMMPVWYLSDHWVAYYDQFEHPETIPPLDLGYLDFWWYNADKAAKLRASGALR